MNKMNVNPEKTQILIMRKPLQTSSTNPLQLLDSISAIPTPQIQQIKPNKFETTISTESSGPDTRLLSLP